MTGKRFIDVSVLPKTFRKISVQQKLAFFYFWTHCDKAGVWEIDADLFEFENGFQLDLSKIGEELGDLIQFNDDIILLNDFVAVDAGRLKEQYNPHKPIFKSIGKHDLLIDENTGKLLLKNANPLRSDTYSNKPTDTGTVEKLLRINGEYSVCDVCSHPANEAENIKSPAIEGGGKLGDSLKEDVSTLQNENLKVENKTSKLIEREGYIDIEENIYNRDKLDNSDYLNSFLSKEQRKVVDDIMNFYDFNEINNFDKLRIISQFIKLLSSKNKFDYFKDQFEAYKAYKTETSQIKHSFLRFLGDIKQHYQDGAWNAENWEAKNAALNKNSSVTAPERISNLRQSVTY